MKKRLIQDFEDLLMALSYFNACEEGSGRVELDRQMYRRKVKEAAETLRTIGVNPDEIIKSGNYLVSETDYK